MIPEASKNNDSGALKHARENEDEEMDSQMKQKFDDKIVEKKEDKGSSGVSVGLKTFRSSKDMFEYFYKFLHF